MERRDQPTLTRIVLMNLVLAAAYIATGHLGLSLAQVQQNAMLIWPPTGIALAALVLWGPRLVPGVILGALGVNLAIGIPLVPAMGITVGNTMEAWVGAAALTHCRFRPSLARRRDVVCLLLIGGLSTIIGATVGVGSLSLMGGPFADVWLIWWLGHVGGVLVFSPLIFVSLRGTPPFRKVMRIPENWVVLGATTLAAAATFIGSFAGIFVWALVFLPFSFLVWAGLRLGSRAAVIASSVVSAIAICGTTAGLGPFVFDNFHATLMTLWAYVATVGTCALALAAAVAERDRAEADQRRSTDARIEMDRQMQHDQRLESLGVLAGGIAHDFNNLLMAIQANAEMLREEVAEADKPLLEDIELATERAGELCSQLLAYAGRRSREFTKLSWGGLIRDVNKLVAVSVSKKVSLQYSIASELPDVSGDLGQLSQVLMNLVINAAEAYEERSGTIRIEAGERKLSETDLSCCFTADTCKPGRHAFVAIHDEAGGMDSEVTLRIFDPFFTTKYTGRGLGLAAVLGIVRAHGGALEVQSEQGVGTSFGVYLPALIPEATTSPAADPIGRTERLTILVADDEPSVLRVTSRGLRARGHEVIEAANGLDAVEIFREQPTTIDVVLLDVMMPELSGPEALSKIRSIAPDIGVVLMSGYDEDEDVESDAFLRKPFSLCELGEQLEEAARIRTVHPARD